MTDQCSCSKFIVDDKYCASCGHHWSLHSPTECVADELDHEKVVSLSSIEKMIHDVARDDKKSLDCFTKRWTDYDLGTTTQLAVISNLRFLEREARNMVSVEVVPLSFIDALIHEFKTNGYRNNYDTKDVRGILETIKEQARSLDSLK